MKKILIFLKDLFIAIYEVFYNDKSDKYTNGYYCWENELINNQVLSEKFRSK